MNPDSFDPAGQKRKPKASNSRRVAVVVFAVAGLLLAVVTMAIMNSGSNMRSSEPQKLFEAASGNADSLENASMFVPSPPEPPQVEEPAEEAPPPPPPAAPGYTTRDARPSVSERRKEAHTVRMLAAGAKSAVDGFAESGAAYAATNGGASGTRSGRDLADSQAELSAALQREAANASGSGGDMPLVAQVPAGNDPNGWAAKDQFLRENKLPEGYSRHFRTMPVSDLELKPGTLIPCVLVSGMNSDLAGFVSGQVTEDVWNSSTGKHILIPKGSKVFGMLDNRISYGQSRVQFKLERVIFPDGSTLTLEMAAGADQSGYTGAKGAVNRHWNSIISAALVVSLLGAGVELVTPDNRNDDDKDAGTIIGENAARSVAEAMSKIIQREADRAPTIKVKPGYRFVIFITQDIPFTQPWSN